MFLLDSLPGPTRRMGVQLGIITTPPQAAQRVADLMVEGGIRAIWNFAPVHVRVPERVVLQNEDLCHSLASLSLKLARRAAELGGEAHEPFPGATAFFDGLALEDAPEFSEVGVDIRRRRPARRVSHGQDHRRDRADPARRPPEPDGDAHGDGGHGPRLRGPRQGRLLVGRVLGRRHLRLLHPLPQRGPLGAAADLPQAHAQHAAADAAARPEPAGLPPLRGRRWWTASSRRRPRTAWTSSASSTRSTTSATCARAIAAVRTHRQARPGHHLLHRQPAAHHHAASSRWPSSWWSWAATRSASRTWRRCSSRSRPTTSSRASRRPAARTCASTCTSTPPPASPW